MKRLQVAYILILTVVGVLFIFRESVNIYWMQTYHADSPLMAIERFIMGHDDEFDQNADTQIADQDVKAEASDTVIKTDEQDGQDRLDAEKRLALQLEAEKKAQELAELEAKNADPYRFLKADENRPIAGPFVPQLPAEVILEAGDKLFFVGDSLMQGVAPRVRQTLYKSDNIDGVDLSKQSTGLAYPNFFNWPKVVAETLSQDQGIKGVIVYLGANDPWDFPVPGRKSYLRFKSAEWERAYRARIQNILLSAKAHNLPVIWLGAPCMRKDKLHKDMVYLNTIYKSEVEKFNGTYLPTSDILGCSDDAYNAYAQTDKGNQKVRTNDGIHFTPTGQRLISERVIEALTIVRPEPESESDMSEEMKSEVGNDIAQATDMKMKANIEVNTAQGKQPEQPTATQPKAEDNPKSAQVADQTAKPIANSAKPVPPPISAKDQAKAHTQAARDTAAGNKSQENRVSNKASSANVSEQKSMEEGAIDAHIPQEFTPVKPVPTPVMPKAVQPTAKQQLQWADGSEISPNQDDEEHTPIYPEMLDIWYTE